MKRTVFFTVNFLFTLSFFCISQSFAGTDKNAVKMDDLSPLTREERAADGNYKALPGWKTLEVVKAGVIDQKLAEHLNTNAWGHGLKLENLQWLQLRNVDLNLAAISSEANKVTIPFGADVRYQLKGVKGILQQGTLNFVGTIELAIQDNEVTSVKVVKYGDSQKIERFGRNIDLINQFDENFLEGRASLAQVVFFKREKSKLIDSDFARKPCGLGSYLKNNFHIASRMAAAILDEYEQQFFVNKRNRTRSHSRACGSLASHTLADGSHSPYSQRRNWFALGGS